MNEHVTFTNQDHHTWKILFERQLELITDWPCREWKRGFKRIKLDPEHVPNQQQISRRIQKTTGWKLVTDPTGFANNLQWNRALVCKTLPVTTRIRKPNELDFTPYPDLFHDYFGHTPFLMVPKITRIIELLTKSYAITPHRQQGLTGRLWWHLMEWSFILQNGEEKIMGAGLIAGKNDFLDGIRTPRREFDLLTALQTPKIINNVQGTYFRFKSFNAIKKHIKTYIKLQLERPAIINERIGSHVKDEIDTFMQKKTRTEPNGP